MHNHSSLIQVGIDNIANNIRWLFGCYIDSVSCSSWRLEESRIHDPSTEAATSTLAISTPLCTKRRVILYLFSLSLSYCG